MEITRLQCLIQEGKTKIGYLEESETPYWDIAMTKAEKRYVFMDYLTSLVNVTFQRKTDKSMIRSDAPISSAAKSDSRLPITIDIGFNQTHANTSFDKTRTGRG